MDNFDYFSSNPPELTEKLNGKQIFIAGAGGLGSNVAMLLVKAGADNLKVIDFDSIEPANINRQFYFRDQVGMVKVEALKANLLRINPDINIEIANVRLTPENTDDVIPATPEIILECFDGAESKALIVSFCLKQRSDIPVITVSGLAGDGPLETIKVSPGPGKLQIIGDGVTEVSPQTGTLSSRVMYAASIQAHLAIKVLC